jgi:hypothetical protein
MNRLLQTLKSGFNWRTSSAAPAAPATAAAPRPVVPAGPAGLGDAIKSATAAIGILPCGGCQKRAAWLNEKVPFGPRK